MGRPRLPISTYGNVRAKQLPSGTWRADTLYRDQDGVTRPVMRTGPTKTAAINRLKEHLNERVRDVGVELNRDSKFSVVAELWLAEIERTESGATYDRYRTRLRNKIMPRFENLRLGECRTALIDRYLRELEKRLSANTVRTYRTVLSGVMAYAVRMDAIDVNPVSGAGKIRGGNARATKRAMTAPEREDFLSKLDADEDAIQRDLPSIMRYQMGTGVRLGEVLGLRWFRVDLDEGIVVHGDNLSRVTQLCQTCGKPKRVHTKLSCPYVEDTDRAEGLVLKEPKSLAGFRVLPLPDFVVLMLRLRYPGGEFNESPVFPNALGGFRDPNNYVGYVQEARDRHGYDWFTSHSCRRTAATILDEQRLSPREISGYIGHANPAFTQRVYMDQRPQSRAAGDALDAAMRPQQPQLGGTQS